MLCVTVTRRSEPAQLCVTVMRLLAQSGYPIRSNTIGVGSD